MSLAASRWRLDAILNPVRLMATAAAVVLAASAFGAPVNDDEVIVPKSSAASNANAPTPAATGSGPLTIVGVLVLAGAGGYMLWRARVGGLNQLSRTPRKLSVEETRSLGNRQFLVVASYQDKKFLIGVCPGRIDLLSALPSTAEVEFEKLHS
jgi:flagellar protein FliO/FliZ